MSKVSTAQKRATAAEGPGSIVRCFALLVVDQAPFLNKALATCLRLRAELHQKQAILNDFEDRDRTAFQQWLHRTHGSELTRIRELWDEIANYQFILRQLSDCADQDYKEIPRLYKELLQLKQQGTLFSYVPRDSTGGAAADEWCEDWDHESWNETREDPLRAFFDQVFGRSASRSRSAAGDRAKSAKKVTVHVGLKACYRALAKRLHPDHSTLHAALREKRWHEMQIAYQNRDLEALLCVEAICDMENTGLTVQLGLARLCELAAYHQSHLTPLRQALKAAERDLAFGFATTGASPEVMHNVACDLESQCHGVKERIASFAQTVASVRDEVEAQLRDNEMIAARVARREKKAQLKREKKQSDLR